VHDVSSYYCVFFWNWILCSTHHEQGQWSICENVRKRSPETSEMTGTSVREWMEYLCNFPLSLSWRRLDAVLDPKTPFLFVWFATLHDNAWPLTWLLPGNVKSERQRNVWLLQTTWPEVVTAVNFKTVVFLDWHPSAILHVGMLRLQVAQAAYRYREYIRLRWISSSGEPTRDSPPDWRLDKGLTTHQHTESACYKMFHSVSDFGYFAKICAKGRRGTGVEGRGMDLSGSGQAQVAGCYEYGSWSPGSIKCGEFLDYPSTC
jgi:hypothetical protein